MATKQTRLTPFGKKYIEAISRILEIEMVA